MCVTDRAITIITDIYATADRLSGVNEQPYSYDNSGNLLSDGVYTYTYDTANRLTQMADGLSTIEYRYNGDGVRVAEIVDGLRTDFGQDIAALAPGLDRPAGRVNGPLFARPGPDWRTGERK